MDNSSILKLIRTTEEKEESISLIKSLLENNYKNRLTAEFESSSPFLRNLWNYISSKIAKFEGNRLEIEKYLNSVLVKIQDQKTLKITLAIKPSGKLVDTITNWAQKNLSEEIIFDIEVDPRIIGGAIIISNKGEFADFSLLKKIDNIFSSKKAEILQ